ncbi:MAG: hypothetical protein E6K80_13015 [Candidatus Eisenbacteria bacterium]|uniref:Polysaccharide export protein n=1 Tax=Eiseniibacteriota bacterium TaxID=2212470 RepID=A0A538TZG4_UNCEI|nr:MAG: hypothetical protein E6K80_13015 [Candidatus Eisenbacteria bacterium]
MTRGMRWLWVVVAFLAWPAACLAQEYVLGPEDVISISIYLHPELERTLAIDAEGNITLPPIGPIKAVGLTPKQLGDKISERLASYLRQTTSVTVTVTQYYSRSVFVQGAVAKPGRYGFERIPSLIDVIGAAGGALPTADLSRVSIVRRDPNGGRRTLYANVAAAQRDGNPATLPQLSAGDIITVEGGVGANGVSMAGDGAGVLGEVTRPGVYPVGDGQDIWTVLAIAGGLTPRGNLSKIRIITLEGATHAVVTLNLKRALDEGSHRPQIVKPGDIVYVMPSGTTKFGQAFGGLQALLSVSTDVLNLIVLQKLVNDNKINR